jgi:hypothetical protein
MDSRSSAMLIVGKGIEGSVGRSSRRQVTLIEREIWESLMRQTGSDAPPSTRRANLMVSGIVSRGHQKANPPRRRRASRDRRRDEAVRADGEAVPGLREAMYGNWGGGAFAKVLIGGEIRVGDVVDWL